MNTTPRLALLFVCVIFSSRAWAEEKRLDGQKSKSTATLQDEYTKSTAELQDDYTHVSARREALKQELEELEAEQTKIEEALNGLDKLSNPPKQLTGAVDALHKAYGELQDALAKNPPDVVSTKSAQALQSVVDALDEVDTQFVDAFPHPSPLSLLDRPKKWREEVYDSDASESLAIRSESIREVYVRLRRLASTMGAPNSAKVEDVRNALGNLPIKDGASAWVLGEFSKVRDQAKPFWDAAKRKAQSAVSKREEQIKEKEEELRALGAALDLRQGQREKTDFNLSLAILFMIGALIILYVTTLFARQSTQAVIFQKRTLVEMIGMAFLLLTIIILGTGEKIEKSVLGTLLGTVGGYIFGQQISAGAGHFKSSKASRRARSDRKKKKRPEAGKETPVNKLRGSVGDPGSNLHKAAMTGGEVSKDGQVGGEKVTPPPQVDAGTSADTQGKPG
jgi:uncharacterized protein YukE